MTSGRTHRLRAGGHAGQSRPAAPGDASGPQRAGRAALFSGAAVFLAALLLFAPTVAHDFVWDDRSILLPNIARLEGSSLGEVLASDFFRESQEHGPFDYWRPLVVLSHAAERSLFGDRPAGYHAVNVLLHALASLLVFLLGLRALGRPALALAAGLLFAVHPAHVEVVAWVSGRSDLLLGLFLALALWGDWQAARTGLRRWQAVAQLGFLAALFSKESAAVFPALIAARAWLAGGPHEGLRERATGALRAALPALATLGAYLWLRYGLFDVAPPQGSPAGASSLSVFWTWWTALLLYARLLVWPTGLSIVHDVPPVAGPFSWAVAGGVLVAIAAVWAALRLRRTAPGASFGLLVLLLGLALLSNFLVPIASHREAAFPVAERFLYAPSIGFSLVVAWLFVEAGPAALSGGGANGPAPAGGPARGHPPHRGRALRRRVAPGLLGLALLAGAWASAERAGEWRDEATLFSATVRDVPDSAMAQLNYGAALVALARSEESADRRDALRERALQHLEHAAALAPENYRGHYNLANLYDSLGRLEAAEASFREALRLRPDLFQAMVNLGILLARNGRPAEALEWLDRAHRLRPRHLAVMVNRAHVLQMLGQAERAIPLYRQALAIEPGLAAARAGLERALAAREDSAGRTP